MFLFFDNRPIFFHRSISCWFKEGNFSWEGVLLEVSRNQLLNVRCWVAYQAYHRNNLQSPATQNQFGKHLEFLAQMVLTVEYLSV